MIRLILTLGACLIGLGCSSPVEAPPLVVAVGFDRLDLVVRNSDARTWTDCTFTLNPGGYTTRYPEVKPGAEARVPSVDLADATGKRFDPYTIKPASFTLTATVNGQPMRWSGDFTPR